MSEAKFPHAAMARQAAGWLRHAQYELDTIYLVKAKCDETSVLFSNEEELDKFVTWAKGVGFEHIGSVPEDTMAQTYGNSAAHIPNIAGPAFKVRFEFLKMPEFPWRIEAMCVLDGVAPLHEEALRRMGEGCVIHISWRAAPNGDKDGYERHRAVLDSVVVGKPQENLGLVALAEYENSYGRFCYYGAPGKPPYLKPRVNLRDD